MYTEGTTFKINDPRLLQHRPPRLLLAGTLIKFCQGIKLGHLDANLAVDILSENSLLPYMIGRTKSFLDLSLGRSTNASKIGDLIVSEECLRGSYELCKSFLEFVHLTICDSSYRDTTKTMLASVIYIANEIYTGHPLWSYKDINDMNQISCLCTKIFHRIISDLKDSSPKIKYGDLEIVCIISLSQNQGHKQLLDVIVGGKSAIKKRIEQVNVTNDISFQESPVVVSVRQSLVIFKKLLSHSRLMKEYLNTETKSQLNSSPSNYQHGASNSDAPITNIERALFDTNIRPGLLQHLFSYIYQSEDSSTACLAVDLINNIAKKFSMSLMACLGSEADKVCEFFVQCLGNKEASVDLGVPILKLLSTCVKHQPGLIELFLNFKKETKGDGSISQEKTHKINISESIKVVMDLLKDCSGRKEDAQKLLHTYVMKFILTFWQKNHSAIEQLDEADQFWESVTQPLVRFLETNYSQNDPEDPQANTLEVAQAMNDKLTSYALMILAREIFCLNAGISERKMSTSLCNILDTFAKKNFMGKYSSFIRKKYALISSNLAKSEDYDCLLTAWRDFLVSFAKYRPFNIEEGTQNQIIGDVLAFMTTEIHLGEKLDKKRIVAAGDILLLLWTKWSPKNLHDDNIFNTIHNLLYLVSLHKEYVPFSFLLAFQSTLNLYLVRHQAYLGASKRTFDLLSPALDLMHFSLRIMEKYLHSQFMDGKYDYKLGPESRLCYVSIMLVRFIIDASKHDVNLWISYLQENLKADDLVQFLTYLMTKRAGKVCSTIIDPEICRSIVDLLLCLSSLTEATVYLNKSSLVNQIIDLILRHGNIQQSHAAILDEISKTTLSTRALRPKAREHHHISIILAILRSQLSNEQNQQQTQQQTQSQL